MRVIGYGLLGVGSILLLIAYLSSWRSKTVETAALDLKNADRPHRIGCALALLGLLLAFIGYKLL